MRLLASFYSSLKLEKLKVRQSSKLSPILHEEAENICKLHNLPRSGLTKKLAQTWEAGYFKQYYNLVGDVFGMSLHFGQNRRLGKTHPI